MVGKRGVYMPDLPPVVDSDMVNALNNFTNNDIDNIMQGKFSDAEIQAAKDRLLVVQNHVNNTATVIQPDEWGSDNANRLLADRAGVDRGRNRFRQRLQQAMNDTTQQQTLQRGVLRQAISNHNLDGRLGGAEMNPRQVLDYVHSSHARRNLPLHARRELETEAEHMLAINHHLGLQNAELTKLDVLQREIQALDQQIQNGSGYPNSRRIKKRNEKLVQMHEMTGTPQTSYWQTKMYEIEHKI